MPRPKTTRNVPEKPKPKSKIYFPKKMGYRKIEDEKYYRAFSYVSASEISKWTKKESGEFTGYGSPKAFAIGTAIHALVLEPPHIAEAICADPERCGGYDENGNGGLTTADWEKIYMCVDALKANKEIMDLLDGCETELGMFYKGRGMQLKGKADALNKSEKYIADVKTTSDVKKFEKSIKKFHYDIQGAFYCTLAGIIDHVYGDAEEIVPYQNFYFLVVDKKNGGTRVVALSPEMIQTGHEKIRAFFKKRGLEWFK